MLSVCNLLYFVAILSRTKHLGEEAIPDFVKTEQISQIAKVFSVVPF